jgi:K+/H+ antiporter YhaU regulatory subunit KhtT
MWKSFEIFFLPVTPAFAALTRSATFCCRYYDFPLNAPRFLIGKRLGESQIRGKANCFVIAIKKDGVMSINPDSITVIEEDAQLIMIGSYDGEKKFLQWNDA